MFETVRDILSKQLQVDPATITPNTNIIDDLGADSLDIVEMLMSIEAETGVTVPDEDVVNFKTVGDVADYLESKAE